MAIGVRLLGSDSITKRHVHFHCCVIDGVFGSGEDGQVHFAKPLPDGRTELRLTPLELIERLAALIPPPRLHRHRYHGVLAPNAPTGAAHRLGTPAQPAAAGGPSHAAPRALAGALSLGAALGAHLQPSDACRSGPRSWPHSSSASG